MLPVFFEVIVINDGTKDNSMDIVKKYDVKIIEQEDKGLSEARNTGVKKATGDYLIFTHQDIKLTNPNWIAQTNDQIEKMFQIL